MLNRDFTKAETHRIAALFVDSLNYYLLMEKHRFEKKNIKILKCQLKVIQIENWSCATQLATLFPTRPGVRTWVINVFITIIITIIDLCPQRPKPKSW